MAQDGDDVLSIDATGDLRRVDAVITRLITDRTSWPDFMRDPNGFFVRAGLHLPTAPEVNDRVNRVFFAGLANVETVKFVADYYNSFRREPDADTEEYTLQGLGKGIVEHRLEYDLAFVERILRDFGAMEKLLGLSLHNLNRRKILQKGYASDEIDQYVGRLCESIVSRRPVRELLKLEVWDSNYGVGQSFDAGVVEVDAVATPDAVAEIGGLATAVTIADTSCSVLVANIEGVSLAAYLGDEDALNTLRIIGSILDFNSALAVHVNSFERH